VLLFGHSSYLPVIHNQAYKAFKGIQNLKDGEIIKVYSATTEYRYAVESVSVADANQDVIELSQTGKYLVLVTCDTFSKKSSRFVVVAKFVGAYPLTSN
jgi:LPXTG-site transpeptidase (sortase) family protein